MIYQVVDERTEEIITKVDEIKKKQEEDFRYLVQKIDSEIGNVRGEIGNVRGEMGQLRNDISQLNQRIDTVIQMLVTLKQDQKWQMGLFVTILSFRFIFFNIFNVVNVFSFGFKAGR